MRTTPHLRRVRLAGLVLPLVLGAAACLPGAEGSPRVAAAVDGSEIPISAVEERYAGVAASPQVSAQLAGDTQGTFRRELQAQVLTQLVRNELLERGASELGIELTQDDLARTRAEIIEEVGGEQAFAQIIEQNNLSEVDVQRELRNIALQDRIAAVVTEQLEVAAADVRQLYEEQRPSRFDLASARHIMVATQEEAQQALERVRAGEDFAEVARELSLDQGTAQTGGDLGEFTRGQYPEVFEEAVFAAEEGELVGPLQVGETWHVVEVTDRRTIPLAEVEEQLRDQLVEERRQAALQEWQQQNAAEAEVVVNPRFGRWDPANAQVIVADPLGDTRPAVPDADIDLQPGG